LESRRNLILTKKQSGKRVCRLGSIASSPRGSGKSDSVQSDLPKTALKKSGEALKDPRQALSCDRRGDMSLVNMSGKISGRVGPEEGGRRRGAREEKKNIAPDGQTFFCRGSEVELSRGDPEGVPNKTR